MDYLKSYLPPANGILPYYMLVVSSIPIPLPELPRPTHESPIREIGR